MSEETPSGTFVKGSDLLPEGYRSPDPDEKVKVVGVRPRAAARPVFFLMDGLRLRVGDKVVTQAADGEVECGEVAESPRVMAARYEPGPVGKVLRRATEEEANRVARAISHEGRARELCAEKIREFDLPMRLIDVKYAFSNQRATFFF